MKTKLCALLYLLLPQHLLTLQKTLLYMRHLSRKFNLLSTRDSSRDGWIKEFIKRNMKFWAVLGSRGCREKTPNCHKYATFWGGFFNFLWVKKMFFCPQKVEKTTSKSCTLMAVGRVFFSAAPTAQNSSKQTRTSSNHLL